jgi:hypothetical protein
MVFIIGFIFFILCLVLFPGINTVTGSVDTTGWTTIQQAEHVVIPFLFLFGIILFIWFVRRKD